MYQYQPYLSDSISNFIQTCQWPFNMINKLKFIFVHHLFLAAPPIPSRNSVSAVLVDRQSVRVSWSAPTVPSGELPINGYNIRYKVQNSNTFRYKTVISNSVEAMITGLVPGTAYQVYVAGVNAIGTGRYCCEETSLVVWTYNGMLSSSCVT